MPKQGSNAFIPSLSLSLKLCKNEIWDPRNTVSDVSVLFLTKVLTYRCPRVKFILKNGSL